MIYLLRLHNSNYKQGVANESVNLASEESEEESEASDGRTESVFEESEYDFSVSDNSGLAKMESPPQRNLS